MGTAAPSAAWVNFEEKKPSVQIIGVDPEGSLYFDFHQDRKITRHALRRGRHRRGFLSHHHAHGDSRRRLSVNDEECFVVARRLAAGRYFHWRFGGGCLSAALRLQRTLDRTNFVVALFRYRYALSQQGLQRRVDARARYVESSVPITAAEVVNASGSPAKSANW